MSAFRRFFNLVLAAIESVFDRIRVLFQKPLHRVTGIRIVPYQGFGNGRALFLKGRVVRNPFVFQVRERETTWGNLRDSLRRFGTNEVPGVEVQLSWGGGLHVATTDEEGYFAFQLDGYPGGESSPMVWNRVELRLVTRTADEPTTTVAEVLVPPDTARFGVISDIDDTVLVSNATQRLRMARLALLYSARARLPFAGVAAFYRALQKGTAPGEFNPVFYVSSSPWNLYDMLVDFLHHQQIPAGPLMLRDIGVSRTVAAGSPHLAHKSVQIKHIMDMYPSLSFILIGDSGQHDPEIYRQAVLDYPNRILAIYIRDVSHPGRDMAVQTIISSLADHSVPMFLVPDTLAAAQHAAATGWIPQESLPEISADGKI